MQIKSWITKKVRVWIFSDLCATISTKYLFLKSFHSVFIIIIIIIIIKLKFYSLFASRWSNIKPRDKKKEKNGK
jgi:hypothetical protein